MDPENDGRDCGKYECWVGSSAGKPRRSAKVYAFQGLGANRQGPADSNPGQNRILGRSTWRRSAAVRPAETGHRRRIAPAWRRATVQAGRKTRFATRFRFPAGGRFLRL